MFHLQIGARNKTVLNDQFGNNVFHLQFRNNVFHAQIGNQNKTVLVYQFSNNMFHLQLGTRKEMFLLNTTRVDVLFLSCKKVWPNKNTTRETISDSAECNLRLDRVVAQALTSAVLSLGSQPDLFPFAEYEGTKT